MEELLEEFNQSLEDCIDLMENISDQEASSVLLTSADMLTRADDFTGDVFGVEFNDPILNFDIFKGQENMTEEELEKLKLYKRLMYCLERTGLTE